VPYQYYESQNEIADRQKPSTWELERWPSSSGLILHFVLGRTNAKGSYVTLLKLHSYFVTKTQIWFSAEFSPSSFSEAENLKAKCKIKVVVVLGRWHLGSLPSKFSIKNLQKVGL
jgi:hypothetical protein